MTKKLLTTLFMIIGCALGLVALILGIIFLSNNVKGDGMSFSIVLVVEGALSIVLAVTCLLIMKLAKNMDIQKKRKLLIVLAIVGGCVALNDFILVSGLLGIAVDEDYYIGDNLFCKKVTA